MYRSIELDGYVIDFRCHKDNPKRPKDWDVSLKFISFWDFPFEARIMVDHVYPHVIEKIKCCFLRSQFDALQLTAAEGFTSSIAM